jgi:chlorophyllide a reductase subunit Y
VESGADVRYVGTACPRTRFSDVDRAWLEQKGVQVVFRASLEQDLAAMAEYQPGLVIGTTPVVQKAKEAGKPALYFTNLISARPLMGLAGAGSLVPVINGALAGKPRFDAMRDFFEGVGSGHSSGVWQEKPVARPRTAKPRKPSGGRAEDSLRPVGEVL